MPRIDRRKNAAVFLAIGCSCAVSRRAIAAETVLKSSSLTAAFDAQKGRIVISTRQGDRLTPRAEAAFESVGRFEYVRVFAAATATASRFAPRRPKSSSRCISTTAASWVSSLARPASWS